MRNLSLILLGVLLTLTQANVYRIMAMMEGVVPDFVVPYLHGATPNLVLPIVVFLGVQESSMGRGAILAFCLGYALDILADAPIGLFSFTYVALWWLARMAGVRLTAQTLLPRMSLAFAFALVEGLLVLVLLAVFGADTRRPVEISTVLLPHAIATALFAPLVFRWVQRLHSGGTGSTRGPAEGAS
ncbi:MAG: rod shape-determining protein MreD [Polyangiaceae bacterium]|nr:rod shape-determining protein MreD [Polyangiaceae bacterium]